MFTVAKENERKQFVCSVNGERLQRVVSGNIIDYTHSNGAICTHKKLELFKFYTNIKGDENVA